MRSVLRTAIFSSLALVMALGLASTSAAGTQAETTVTIKEQSGDFSGRVNSEDEPRCSAGRTVVLKQKRPGKDDKIATDTTEDNGKWSTGNTNLSDGRFYAQAKEDPDCKSARSEIVKL